MTGSLLGISVLARAARALPPAADRALAEVAACAARLVRPERERAARDNAASLFPALGPREHARLARRSGAAYARFVIEYLRSLGDGRERLAERVRLAADPSIAEAVARGRGMVVCAAHVGNWELGALALPRLGRPVTVVARPQYLAGWRARVRAAKESAGIRVIAPEAATTALARSLARGGVVALLVDGDGYARGRRARIAGREVTLPSGPARLAARTGAVLAGGCCVRAAAGRFVTRIEPLGRTEHAPVAAADLLHDAVAAWLERTLLAHPGGWCVFRPFFTAAGGASAAPGGACAGPQAAPAPPRGTV